MESPARLGSDQIADEPLEDEESWNCYDYQYANSNADQDFHFVSLLSCYDSIMLPNSVFVNPLVDPHIEHTVEVERDAYHSYYRQRYQCSDQVFHFGCSLFA